MNKVAYILLSLVMTAMTVKAGDETCTDSVGGSRYGLGLDMRPAYVVPSNGYVEGDNAVGKPIDKSLSAYMKFSFTLDPKSRLGKMYPDAYQGIGIGFTGFADARDIGTPFSVYAFQGAPIARLNNRLSLDYEWNFGASFGWKKYHEDKNPSNGAVGSSTNAYINLALMLKYRLNRNWYLSGGLDFTHYSNGNTDYPNSGINLIGLRMGLVYMLNSSRGNSVYSPSNGFEPHFVYDVALYCAARKCGFTHEDTRYLIPGRFGVLGLNAGPVYRFNKYFGLGASLDLQYDEGANIGEYYEPNSRPEDPRFYRPPFARQFGAGLSVRAEVTMGFFTINSGLGHNVVYKGSDLDGFYQMFVLKTFVTPKLFLNVGYKLLRFKDPGNLMLGVGYRFNGSW